MFTIVTNMNAATIINGNVGNAVSIHIRVQRT